MGVPLALVVIVLVSYVIASACNAFSQSAAYLGRSMGEGVKGGLINAVGSSMPEMMTASALLLLLKDEGGFAAGISVTVGSAIVNAVVIPLLCLLAVRWRGIDGRAITCFTISKKALRRDGLWLLLSQLVLLFLLITRQQFAWWAGALLLVVYGGYLLHLLRGSSATVDSYEFTPLGSSSFFAALVQIDLNRLLFADRPLTARSAWINLLLTTAVIGVACHFLSVAVVSIATELGISVTLSALLFAAAATSVPDAVLSVKDAINGGYDDALANALGSNTFDVTVALGLPLMLYGLVAGPVQMPAGHNVLVLQGLSLAATVVVLALFYCPKKIDGRTVVGLVALLLAWIGYTVSIF